MPTSDPKDGGGGSGAGTAKGTGKGSSGFLFHFKGKIPALKKLAADLPAEKAEMLLDLIKRAEQG